MDFFSDRNTLMDLDLQFQDDNTSCSSSSFSATISEDIDDLRLGAEANTFSSKYDESPSKRPVQKFEIMKENSDCYSPDDPNYTVSTISSISDLIDAREGRLDDLLQGLGFLSFDGEESHNSILSRFHSSPKRRKSEDTENTTLKKNENFNLDPNVHCSISKTQEWLDRQQNLPEPTSPSTSSKDSSGTSTKTNGSTNLNQSKRIPAQKKRNRWSKSRQSSFEHLLPNLEEEESAPYGEKSDSSGSSQMDRRILPIRESSQEKENFSPDDNINNCENSQKIPENQELLKKLHKLEIRQKYDQDAEVRILTELHASPQRRVGLTQHNNYVITANNMGDTVDQMVLTESSPVRLSPWKHLGRKNLLNMKVDSFELEEIASNDGCQSPDVIENKSCSLKPNGKSCYHSNGASSPLICLQRSDSSGDENRGLENSLSSTFSDSSSGFDEGLEDVTTPLSSKSNDSSDAEKIEDDEFCAKTESMATISHYNTMQIKNYADETAYSICHNAISHCRKISWQKFDEFCASRSKIICASGVAEYALRMQKLQAKFQRRSIKSASWSNFEEVAGGIFQEKSHDQNEHQQICQRTEDCRCGSENCATSKRSLRSPKGHKMPNIFSDARQDLSSNVNNNNINNRSLEHDRGRLIQFSSMPTLPWASNSPPCRKTKCQRLSSGATNHARRENSLMSSISDVTYLSYKKNSSNRQNTESVHNMQPCSKLLDGKFNNATASKKMEQCSTRFVGHSKQKTDKQKRRSGSMIPRLLTNGVSHVIDTGNKTVTVFNDENQGLNDQNENR